MAVPDGLPRCIRVLIHWNTDKPQSAIHHVYLREARSLRPDKALAQEVDLTELQAWIDEQLAAWNQD